MKIKGKNAVYNVYWGARGFSYACVFIYKPRRFWFNKLLRVSTANYKTYIEAENLHKSDLVEWFEESVRLYEDYVNSFSKD